MFNQITPEQFKLVADYGIAFVLAFILLIVLPLGATMAVIVWRTNANASKRQDSQNEYLTRQIALREASESKRLEHREEREDERFSNILTLLVDNIGPIKDIALSVQESVRQSQARDAKLFEKLDRMEMIVTETRALNDGLAKKNGTQIEELLQDFKRSMEVINKDIADIKELHPKMNASLSAKIDSLAQEVATVRLQLGKLNGEELAK